MTLDELNQINVDDPAQVKALQSFLKSRGYYAGPLDSKWGGGTVEGVKSLRTDLQSEAQTRATTAQAGAETARTNLQAEQEKSSWGRFSQEFGPYGAGAAGGLLSGYGIMRGNAAADKRLGEETGRMVTDKRIGPVAAEKTMDSRLRGRTQRAGKQMLNPAAAFGLAEVTRRYIKPNVSAEIQPYVDLAASAEQGLGGGMAVMTIKDALSSKNPIPADTEALIRSRAAEARGDPHTISNREKAATAPSGPDPARMAELRAKKAADLRVEAKAAGLHVSGTKEDLARRIAEAPPPATGKKGRLPRGKAGLLAPLAAGAMAYDAASGDAEAAGAAPMEARGKGVLAGAGAAGLTAGAGALMRRLPQSIGSAAGAAGMALMPGMAADAYDPEPDQLATDRNTAARHLPAALRFGAIEDAYQASLLPGRGDRSDEIMMARDQASQAERMPMASASSLRISRGGQDFDAMLAEFVAAIEEHNAGVGGEGR